VFFPSSTNANLVTKLGMNLVRVRKDYGKGKGSRIMAYLRSSRPSVGMSKHLNGKKFSLHIGWWPENQILISDWTYFRCPMKEEDFLTFKGGACRGRKLIGRNLVNWI